MPTDRYTKAVLTVIAAALVAIAAQNVAPTAIAQQPPVGCTVSHPCYVTNTGIAPLAVTDARPQAPGGDRYRNLPPNSGQPR